MTPNTLPAANHVAQSHKYPSQSDFASLFMKKVYQQQKSYVSALVDITVQVIASIWPNAVHTPSSDSKPIADLNVFLGHILKHSRTTHSTLQLAIFYLFRIRSNVQKNQHQDVYMSCGRRMFLAALISAHKYLQDKTYKNSAWSKVSGLDVREINHAERVLLELLEYRLYVKKDTYDQWISMLQTHLPAPAAAVVTPPMMEQQVKKRQQQLLVAQQSLPSPPLEESFMTQKRKLGQDDNDDKRKRNKI